MNQDLSSNQELTELEYNVENNKLALPIDCRKMKFIFKFYQE